MPPHRGIRPNGCRPPVAEKDAAQAKGTRSGVVLVFRAIYRMQDCGCSEGRGVCVAAREGLFDGLQTSLVSTAHCQLRVLPALPGLPLYSGAPGFTGTVTILFLFVVLRADCIAAPPKTHGHTDSLSVSSESIHVRGQNRDATPQL